MRFYPHPNLAVASCMPIGLDDLAKVKGRLVVAKVVSNSEGRFT